MPATLNPQLEMAALDAFPLREPISRRAYTVGFGRFVADPGIFQEMLRSDAIDVVRPDSGLHGVTQCRRIAAVAEPYYVAAAPFHEGGPISTPSPGSQHPQFLYSAGALSNRRRRPADARAGGGRSGKVTALANVSSISMAPHACEGPIGMLASLHLDASIPNLLIQECCGQAVPQVRDKVWEEWFGFPVMRMVNGKYPLLERPGLGFDLTEDALKKYPFAGTKPMSRVFHKDGSVAEW